MILLWQWWKKSLVITKTTDFQRRGLGAVRLKAGLKTQLPETSSWTWCSARKTHAEEDIVPTSSFKLNYFTSNPQIAICLYEKIIGIIDARLSIP